MPEFGITIGKRCEVSGQILKLPRNQMNNLALALDFYMDRHHARPEHDAPPRFEEARHTTMLAMPVSSWIVMNIPPLALSGF
ncbi:hypothetical protein D3C73_1167750 [compost metagenome]